MKGKELLEKVISTGYSMSTMQMAFNAGKGEEKRSDEVARLIDETNSEEELLRKLEELPD